jgi:hypothetical protein
VHTHDFILMAAASRGQRARIFLKRFVPGQGASYTDSVSETISNARTQGNTMRVTLMVYEDRVVAMRADEPCAPEDGLEIGPGQMLGTIPYSQLRRLGDGDHDLPLKLGYFCVMEDTNYRRAGYLLAAIGLLILMPFIYAYLADLEATGGRGRANAIIVLVYYIGGKIGVALMMLMCSAIAGFLWYIEKKKEE